MTTHQLAARLLAMPDRRLIRGPVHLVDADIEHVAVEDDDAEPVDLVEALARLREASGGAWDGVDVEAYLGEVRGDRPPATSGGVAGAGDPHGQPAEVPGATRELASAIALLELYDRDYGLPPRWQEDVAGAYALLGRDMNHRYPRTEVLR